MKISSKTLAAARKAAKNHGMSLDDWAEQVLANAAKSGEPADIEARLRDISRKVDQIVARQSLGERTNEQIQATLKEMGPSFEQWKRSTGQILGDVGSKASSAVGEVAERARGLIGQVNKSASELAERLAARTEVKDEVSGAPTEANQTRANQTGANPTKPNPTMAKKAKVSRKARATGSKGKAAARRPSSTVRKSRAKQSKAKT